MLQVVMGSLKGTGPLFLALLVACLLLCASSQGPRYQNFLWQHHDNPRTDAGRDYCGVMMQSRGMARPCKDINTFIHASLAQIRSVCRDGGTLYQGMLYQRRSKRPLAVTTCELKRTQGARCIYRSHAASRYIVIGCNHGMWPVQYNEKA
ncbi:ribonuclease-like [Dermochelys coriacea]|uniref:ribonuclease-like n=1 Tax=Dermochelys coriacea TaxID=27794 RepID=UPI0018E885E5|nr:ribonuclease-like [Dermochelys coriacea]